jgi:hypothetical protein
LTLIREIERWRQESSETVCFVTFNYDRMLEEAIKQFQEVEIKNIDDYLSLGPYMVVKPHGSTNWGFEVDAYPDGYTPQRIIKEVETLQITKRIRLVSRYPMAVEDRQVVFPAISIPVQNKDEFTCPENHISALADVLPKVTKVLTVGWRATEADFLRMLGSPLTGLPQESKLMVVSGDQTGAAETVRNMKRIPSTHSVITGFTGLIENIDALGGFLRLASQKTES